MGTGLWALFPGSNSRDNVKRSSDQARKLILSCLAYEHYKSSNGFPVEVCPAVILADGIDFPVLLLYGLIVLVPLMVFQVGVEGGILSRLWGIPFKQLTRVVFVANCWSLIAGIPTKILNSWLYGSILPNDPMGYFKYYRFAAAAGTFVYFTSQLSTRYRSQVETWHLRLASFHRGPDFGNIQNEVSQERFAGDSSGIFQYLWRGVGAIDLDAFADRVEQPA